ncbi:MAG: trypsin-like peptidase domain-containing protein [Nitrospira sp.]|nr:trypsin-like peptidase domain-containing protein [Nitrospira sp.]
MTSLNSRHTAIQYTLITGVALLFLATAWEVKGAIQRNELNHDFDSQAARTMLEATVGISVDGRSHELGTGGGVIFLPSGTIITNGQVVDGATAVDVRLADGRHRQGHVVRRDPFTDLAVIQLVDTGVRWPPLKTGNSDRVRVGDQVFLIAATQSGGELRRGRITDLYPMQREVRLIQTSIPIRSDEAGSALVNADGHIIGIVTTALPGGRSVASATAVNSAKDLVLSMVAGPAPSPLQEVPNETPSHSPVR